MKDGNFEPSDLRADWAFVAYVLGIGFGFVVIFLLVLK